MADMNTEAETGLAGQMPIEQTVEISADGEESESTDEVSDMSDENTLAGNLETNLRDPSSSDDTQTHYIDEAEIDETKPQK